MLKLKQNELAAIGSLVILRGEDDEVEITTNDGSFDIRSSVTANYYNQSVPTCLFKANSIEKLLIKIINSDIAVAAHVAKIDKKELKNKIKELI